MRLVHVEGGLVCWWDGRVASCLAEPIPYGEGKVRAIERNTGPSRLIAAFGDSMFDLEMLGCADVPCGRAAR